MKVCLVGSILRHTVHSDAGTYSGWGGMTESAVAPFASLLNNDSVIHFVGSVGKEDIIELKTFFKDNYPFVNTDPIHINPTGTDHVEGTKDFVRRKLQVEPTKYEHIKPYIHDVDVVIFNFGNIDDIDPEAIKKVKENSKALVYVDVHRKPFGANKDGYMYARGWPGWQNYLGYADVVQINKNECEALFSKKLSTIGDVATCAREVLSAGARRVIITLGNQGVLFADKPTSFLCQYFLAPAIPCRVVDTTGCGDAFAAGYLVSTHEKGSLFQSIKYGSFMASINCEFVGYTKGLDRETVEKKMPSSFSITEVGIKDITSIV